MTYNYIFATLLDITAAALSRRLRRIGAKCKCSGPRVLIAYPDGRAEHEIVLAAGGHIHIHSRGSENADGDFEAASWAWL
jgi:hypothetical protein